MRRSLRYVVPLVVVAATLTVPALASAMPQQNGSTFITTPNCLVLCEASRGSTIYAHARFVDPNVGINSYNLYLSSQAWCTADSGNAVLAVGQMANADQVIPATNTDPPAAGTDLDGVADGDGKKFADVAGEIPATVSRGTYDVCFAQLSGVLIPSYSTSPVSLTVKS